MSCINLLVITLSFIKNPVKPINYKPKLLINNFYNSNIKNGINYIPCEYDKNEKCLIYEKKNSNKIIILNHNFINNIEIFLYSSIWILVSLFYNIDNKKRLLMLNLPYLQSSISLGVGSVIVLIIWKFKLRKTPILSYNHIKTYIPIAFFHSIGHITAVISVSTGAVSFTQIIKAAEPIFTAFFYCIILKDTISLHSILALLLIVFGVGLASVSEISFTWISFITAMLSNIAFSSRNVFSRLNIDKPKGENITSENLFGILTICSFVISLPFTIILDLNKLPLLLENNIYSVNKIISTSINAGAYFYIYNEVAMTLLNKINPVSHSIINTLKRVIILITCCIFFNTDISINGIIGSTIAIIGSFIYSKIKINKNK